MSDIDCLILDFGLYPGASGLRNALIGPEAEGIEWYVSTEVTEMGPADWDEILEKLQRAGRCITL